MQLQTTSPESKFPNEYSDVIFIQIDQHLKSYCKNTKGSRFSESRCIITGKYRKTANISSTLTIRQGALSNLFFIIFAASMCETMHNRRYQCEKLIFFIIFAVFLYFQTISWIMQFFYYNE